MTLVTNLYGGPGTGKSTIAALVFGKLKLRGIRAELATEYAKELTWEERHSTLEVQEYVMAKQLMRLRRVEGKVDVVVSDSPILQGLAYARPRDAAWAEHLVNLHREMDTFDIFLRRNPDKTYDEAGRNQSRTEAEKLDGDIERILEVYGRGEFREIPISLNEDTANRITDLVLHQIGRAKPA
jgi:hypothetical protein